MVGQSSRQPLNIVILFSLLISAFVSMGASADFSASVNRTTLSAHESLELTLRTDESSNDAPDLTPLEWSFDVLGTRQHSQTSYINGRKEYSREWTVTLIPKQEGTLVIPPIALGDQKSEPISIIVTDQSARDPSVNDSPLFMKAEVNHDDIYIQQELVLTLKIFYSIQLYDDNRLSSLNVDDALVQKLGETSKFDTVINGIRYQGFELKYSIHPQSAGELIIPSMKFTGTAAEARDPFGSFFSRSGKPVIARSPELRINVKPRPDNYPSSDAWLPARNLTIQEQWSQPLDNLKVGDAITRTITLSADGLSSAQLPPILMPHPEGVNSYPDKSNTADSETPTGIRGERTDSIAMIPTKAGIITLPAIEYTWFDTTNGEVKTTTLPETNITVAEAASVGAPVITPTPEQPAAILQPADCPDPIQSTNTPDNNILLWKVLTGVFALLWLITLGLWKYRKAVQPTATSEQAINSGNNKEGEEDSSFKQFEAACQARDTLKAFNELKAWSRLYLQNNQLDSLSECLEQLNSTKLKDICNSLSASRYSASPSTTDNSSLMADLLDECQKIRSRKVPETGDKAIRKLYPQ